MSNTACRSLTTLYEPMAVLQDWLMAFTQFRAGLLMLPVGLSLCCGGTARAALGGGPVSVNADAAAFTGVDHLTPMQQYDVHEITWGNGMSIREFMSRGGIVFAVTWTGPAMPDLQTVLGVNYSSYVAALAQVHQRARQRSLRIAAHGLIVETEGHLRAYSGRAYLPELLPAGTPSSDLR